ncbi:MAG: HEAT repeat domain-containing protein [Planctomycetota bacterium]|jgi:hypothetical protein
MKKVWPLWIGIMLVMMTLAVIARARGRAVSVAQVAADLERDDPAERRVTALQLSNVPAPRSVPAVIARLKVEPEPDIRVLLLKALIQAGTYEGAKGVCVGLHDAHADVRAEARMILEAWYEWKDMPQDPAEVEAVVNSRPPKLLRKP